MTKLWLKSKTTDFDAFSIEINEEKTIEDLKCAIKTEMQLTYPALYLKVLTVRGGSEYVIKPGAQIKTVLSDSTNSEENPIYFKELEGKSFILTEIIFHSFNIYLFCSILVYTQLY